MGSYSSDSIGGGELSTVRPAGVEMAMEKNESGTGLRIDNIAFNTLEKEQKKGIMYPSYSPRIAKSVDVDWSSLVVKSDCLRGCKRCRSFD